MSTGGGGGKHHFIELYNPTMTDLDTPSLVRLHVRSAAGSDTVMSASFTHPVIPSHRFQLLASMKSNNGDAWFGHRDGTYNDDLTANGCVYLSLQAGAQAQVIDKLGWGTQPPGGYEGAATADLPADQSVQRKPAGGAAPATDTDNNASDFDPPSSSITPLGTLDPAAP